MRSRALITGAGAKDGIGFACARLLAETGFAVALSATTDRVLDRVSELNAAGHTASGHIGDLTLTEDVDQLLSELGNINVLVNNAGMGTKAKPTLEKRLTQMAADEWDHEIAVSGRDAVVHGDDDGDQVRLDFVALLPSRSALPGRLSLMVHDP